MNYYDNYSIHTHSHNASGSCALLMSIQTNRLSLLCWQTIFIFLVNSSTAIFLCSFPSNRRLLLFSSTQFCPFFFIVFPLSLCCRSPVVCIIVTAFYQMMWPLWVPTHGHTIREEGRSYKLDSLPSSSSFTQSLNGPFILYISLCCVARLTQGCHLCVCIVRYGLLATLDQIRDSPAHTVINIYYRNHRTTRTKGKSQWKLTISFGIFFLLPKTIYGMYRSPRRKGTQTQKQSTMATMAAAAKCKHFY